MSCDHLQVETQPVAKKYVEVEDLLERALDALRPFVVCCKCGEKMTREAWSGRNRA